MERRGIENLKIHCADEHFKEISNSEVKFEAVSSYEKMMALVKLK
jgi:type III restriction enzyme